MGFLKNVKYAYKKCVYKIDETREHFCSTEGVKRVESGKFANKTFLLEKEHKFLVSKWDALDWYNDKGLVLGFDSAGRKRELPLRREDFQPPFHLHLRIQYK